MSKATKETLSRVHKPFDFVESKNGSIGFIQEVNINECQDGFDDQVSYTVNWIKKAPGVAEKIAWWRHDDLIVFGNMFKEIAKCATHSFGNHHIIDQIM